MIIQLSEESAHNPSLTGGKGSQLAVMISNGFPVPPGFVVSTEVFNEFCANNDILEKLDILLKSTEQLESSEFCKKVDAFQAFIRQMSLPVSLLEQLEQQLALGGSDSFWAVRSSAVAEDMEGASFAGQYDTVLGVTGISEIGSAILHCWASFFNSNAIQYKKDLKIDDNRAAVVVQQLVNADAAGVCFSMNPLNGNKEEVVINANVGLGESVVGGLVTPDTYILNKTDHVLLSIEVGSKKVKTIQVAGGSKEVDTSSSERSQRCLTDAQCEQVVSLVKQVEQRDGHCVDIEWAIVDEKVYLLQSRPVTSNASDAVDSMPSKDWVPEFNSTIDPQYPLYTNGNISEILPGCITPLTWSRVAPTIDYAFTKQLFEMGVINETPDPLNKLETLGIFYYRPYIRISYFTETAIATPGLSPDLYLEEFIAPPSTKTPGFVLKDLKPTRIYHFLKILTLGVHNLARIRKRIEWSEAYINDLLEESSDTKIHNKSSQTLIDSVAFTNRYGELSVVHIWVSTFASIGFGIIRKCTERWFGDDRGTLAASLITGIGVLPSAEPSFDIYRLAECVLHKPKLFALFDDQEDERVYSALQSSSLPEAQVLLSELNTFLEKHGHRGIGENELMSKCWRDEPSQVIGMVRNFLLPNAVSPSEIQQQQKQASKENTDRSLAKLNTLQRRFFTSLLRFVRFFVEKREVLKNFITLREDRARVTFQELARRLVASGDLDNEQDIYFLTWKEIQQLVYGELPVTKAQATLSNRQRDFKWSKLLRMPKLIQDQAQPISAADMEGSTTLTGMGVYPGQIEGKARVVLDPRTENKVEPGEIIIAPVTDAGWTPLFINAAALVVEVGGLLSHGSVVAREYGLPTIVGAEGATQMIKTGDRVVVDGMTGVVALLG